jgi:hypothetical protein
MVAERRRQERAAELRGDDARKQARFAKTLLCSAGVAATVLYSFASLSAICSVRTMRRTTFKVLPPDSVPRPHFVALGLQAYSSAAGRVYQPSVGPLLFPQGAAESEGYRTPARRASFAGVGVGSGDSTSGHGPCTDDAAAAAAGSAPHGAACGVTSAGNDPAAAASGAPDVGAGAGVHASPGASATADFECSACGQLNSGERNRMRTCKRCQHRNVVYVTIPLQGPGTATVPVEGEGAQHVVDACNSVMGVARPASGNQLAGPDTVPGPHAEARDGAPPSLDNVSVGRSAPHFNTVQS